MVFTDGRRVSPQAWQKITSKYLLTILCAEHEVNMILRVAVGHGVASSGACHFPRASTPGLVSFAPAGANVCESNCSDLYRLPVYSVYLCPKRLCH